MSETIEYPVCEYCSQERKPGVSCTVMKITIQGQEHDRVPYANERRPEPHDCHDCNTPLGGIHHANCDMERCPKCGTQFITCGCGPGELPVATEGKYPE